MKLKSKMKNVHGNSLTKEERFNKYVKELNKIHNNRFEYIFESFSALTNPIEFIDKTTGKKHKQLLTNHFKSLPRELRNYSKDQMLPISEIENRLKEIFKESTLVCSLKADTKLSGKLHTKCSVCDTEYNKRISDYRKHPLCGTCVKNDHKRLKEEYYKSIIEEKYPNFEILELDWKGYAETKVRLREDSVEFDRYLETLVRNNSNSSNIKPVSLEDRRINFKEKSLLAHNSKYDYDIPLYLEGSQDTRTTLDFYYNQRSLVPIYCPVHKNIFKQAAGNHLLGHGCDLCANEKNAKSLIRDPYDVILQAKQIHRDEAGIPLYEYDEVFLNSYKGSTEVASIYCKIHKKYFPQNLSHHLAGSGCPDCANIKRSSYKISQAEKELKEYLESLGLKVFSTNYLENMEGLELDLYIPSMNLAIEYNGHIYHHSSFDSENEYFKTKAKESDYHLKKYNLCKKSNINLIHIWDFEDLIKWKDMLYKYVNNPDKYIITFKNILRVYNGLNCYGISTVEEVV